MQPPDITRLVLAEPAARGVLVALLALVAAVSIVSALLATAVPGSVA